MTKISHEQPPAFPSWTGPGAFPAPPPPPPGTIAPNAFGANRPAPPHLIADELRGRYGKTEKANRQTLLGQTINRIDISRPSIVVCIGVPTDLIYYQADQRPGWRAVTNEDPDSQTGTGSSVFNAPLKSSGSGTCYLPAPGTWYLYPNQSTSIDVAVVPAEDPAMAGKYLAEGGVSVQNGTPATSVIVTGVANVAQSIPANRNRKCLIIQSANATTTPVRLQFGGTIPAAADLAAPNIASTGVGLWLTNQGSITLQGDSCFRGIIWIGSAVAWHAVWLDLS